MSSSTNEQIKEKKDIPEEKPTIDFDLVKLPTEWSFWESYSLDDKKLSYEKAMKLIYSWDNIISFWQFWNHYPGNKATNIFFNNERVIYFFEEGLRINAMNIFVKGIKPAWEDEKNDKGSITQVDYRIDKDKDEFFRVISSMWTKLILETMAFNLPYGDHINGIRFVDKFQHEKGKIIMFRFEIWKHKSYPSNGIDDLHKYLKNEIGCSAIKEMPINTNP